MENDMEVPQKIEIRTTIPSSSFTLGIYLKKKNTNLKRNMHLDVHSSIIYNSKDNGSHLSAYSRWMDKEKVTHTHTTI